MRASCYNRASMLLDGTNLADIPLTERLRSLLLDWREDWVAFLRHDVPKIVLVIAGAVVLIRIVRVLTRGMTALHVRRIPPGLSTRHASRR